MANESAEQLLEQAILNYARVSGEDHGMLTGWIVVAESVNEEGVPTLNAYASQGLPWWRINGMIDAAPEQIEYLSEDEEYD